MAGHGGYCTPLEHCCHRWGHPHRWPSLVSRTFLRMGEGRRADVTCFLMRLKSKCFGVHRFAQPSHWTLMNDESRPIGPQPIPSRVPSERTGLQRMIGSDFFPPLVCFDLANLSNSRWATTEWTMPLLRKQRAMAGRLLGWHYSRLLLEEAQNNYMLGLWLIQFN